MAAVSWLGSKPGHIQFGGFLLGPGTPWRWDEMEGWEETPGLDSGTVLRASEHGAWPGLHYAQTRIVTLSVIVRSEPGQMYGAIRQLAAATPIDQLDEVPLVAQFDEETPQLIFARCIRRAVQVGRSNRTGLARGSLQWEATDPRKYALLESQVTTALPQPEPGLAFPLAFPLDFGTPGSSGNVTVVNTGDAPSNPAFAITGPCSRPAITNLHTGLVLEYDLALGPSDVLYIDTQEGTVTLNGQTANRLYTATTRSAPEGSFVLPPGSTSLAFRSDDNPSDPAASLVATWRSAYW